MVDYESSESALDEAIYHVDLEKVQEILQAEPELINQPDEQANETPLDKVLNAYFDASGRRQRASETGLVLEKEKMRLAEEIVRFLVEAGADVNVQNEISGQTPLMNANSAENARVLVDAGADVNARENHWGQTPLFYAWTAEHAKVLLDAGADPNARTTNNKLPCFE